MSHISRKKCDECDKIESTMLGLTATQPALAGFAKDVTPPHFKFAHVRDVDSRMQIKIPKWKHFKTVLLIAS